MKWNIILLSLIFTMGSLFANPVQANPTVCPSYPIPEDAYWRPDGQPAGELVKVAYYEGLQSIYCYYRNSSGLILGFLSSKFAVTELEGTDWRRISPCPLEKSCYICEKRSETSCHFHS